MKNISRKCMVLGLTVAMMIGMTLGCGKSEDQMETEKKKPSSTETSKTEEKESNKENNGFVYKDLSDYEFYFSSGAGGWATQLLIHEDGSFEGSYQDPDMGDTASDYPNGIQYSCDFTGQFTDPIKVDEVTYSAEVKSIQCAKEPGTEEIKDGVKYIYSQPYGLDGAKKLLFYLPAAKIAELPEGYQSWINMAIQPDQTELSFYGLYNEAEETGFTSYSKNANKEDTSTNSIDEELSTVAQKEAELNDELQKKDITQTEMNEISAQIYKLWDDELNVIWEKLKSTLDENAMDQLIEEERAWIKEKEDKVKKAGAEVEGGTMQPSIENSEAAALTKERVYELAKKLN